MRILLSFLVWSVFGALAWDAYEAGIPDAVATNGAVTLAERLADASVELPRLLQGGARFLRGLISPRETAGDWLTPLPDVPERTIGQLNPDTVWAMQLAAKRTDVSLTYLVNTAHLEANLDPSVKSRTSSATGLFQFIDQTWLKTLHTYGARYGWAGYQNEISCENSGYCSIKAAEQRPQILDLRYDAMTSTFLAAELARENRAFLVTALGAPVTDAQLYMAHLLGANGAVRLMTAAKTSPAVTAQMLFPMAASANRSLFYGPGGKALTVQQFYDKLEQRWQQGVRELNAQSAIKAV